MVVRGKAADEANWVVPQEHGSCPLKDKGFLLFGKYEKGVAADDVAISAPVIPQLRLAPPVEVMLRSPCRLSRIRRQDLGNVMHPRLPCPMLPKPQEIKDPDPFAFARPAARGVIRQGSPERIRRDPGIGHHIPRRRRPHGGKVAHVSDQGHGQHQEAIRLHPADDA